MKRVGNIYELIYDMSNIVQADQTARKGKKSRYGIDLHDRNREANLHLLQQRLVDGSYKTSAYRVFEMVTDAGKLRQIYRLPYFPDRIAHHAIMNVLEPYFVNSFIRDTYACVKGRGIHDGVKRVKQALRYKDETRYCLKMDVRKFFPSIDNVILKRLLRRRFKDVRLLALLDEIIDSSTGVPIGNYLSQYFANFYLSYFDHWLKEQKHVRHYFRYCDDMVILGSDKAALHRLRAEIESYLKVNLNLTLKNNWQVFPVDSRGINFLGYVFFHDHTRLRKTIKQSFARKIAKAKGHRRTEVVGSYKGWCMHGNCINLYKTITGMKLFSELGITVDSAPMSGEKIKINRVVNKEIEVVDYELNESKYNESAHRKCLKLQVRYEGELRVIFTGSNMLIKAIQQVNKAMLPFKTVIVEQSGFYQFT
ncbi:reverse transcriptase (RNA-dependent DNA polymerase) [Mangrovibacterium marinum]|uniref:Reverse transcriptase (RNA-dependent DNA polymerase) n=1 Tax=Mangrovibacterium marinum TaxID=1639118 RepID=A0A2T5C0B8_9BACT|nr:reverse transcriptase/maturase family protein [Mangrovibacterium marinum]PTN08035.1 reverse transcriptase (RNA-dependent DNA polymerase) [Mangrovibacterium marinum]